MFMLTALVYPLVLALLCVGAGLLVDRAGGGVLPAMLIPTVGVAGLIVASQLTTYVAPLAPATPYVLVGVAAGGYVLGWPRVRAWARARVGRFRPRENAGVAAGETIAPLGDIHVSLWRRARAHKSHLAFWPLLLAPIAYALALAPVLLAARPSFSSYLALADSAVHMVGADFLISHGQDYAQLDLHNSYGATIGAYYNASYPSGADTFFGGSSLLLGLPLMWTFQPFTALMLAFATGPAWVLVRRLGLDGAWAAVAALTVTLPALVYAYELIGSVKEIVALLLMLAMGALVVEHRRWLWAGARAAIPFALIVGAGVGALGVAFGAWALVATLVLAGAALAELVGKRRTGTPAGQELGSAMHGAASAGQALAPARAYWQRTQPLLTSPSLRRLAWVFGAGTLVLLVCALPTWANLSGSFSVAQGIASTSNPGNLHSPLHPTQLFGVWLGGSYKLLPTGVSLTLTSVLIALASIAVVMGVGFAVRSGRYAFTAWFALTILLWLVLRTYATTWADAKTLMLTSPVVVLMAWAGIAALRASGAVAVRIAAPLVALLLLGGVLASDALQYNASNLAPTARYQELASLNTRFGGRGPTLFTDFDEYALYELRNLDVGGPDFVYPPPALVSAAGGHGQPVRLDRIAPAALLAYPLILTRRDPTAARPPVAYRLLWRGTYYEVWGRIPGALPALAHVAPVGSARARCLQVGHLVSLVRARVGARTRGGGTPGAGLLRASSHAPGIRRLVGALAPQLVVVPIPRSRLHRPPGWARAGQRILMRRPGSLRLAFRLLHRGLWQVWLQGDVMRVLDIAVDGRPLGSLGAQLGGNSLVPNTLSPLLVRLSAGPHTLTISRPGANLAPGDGGAAVLSGVFLTPAGPAGRPSLLSVPLARWRSLCARDLQWVELMSKG